MSHIISTEDLRSFETSTTMARAIGRGGNNKSLNIRTIVNIENVITSKFVVEDKNTVVLTTESLEEAVKKYNSI